MKSVEIFDLKFTKSSFGELLQEIAEKKFRNSESLPFLITPNADQVLQYSRRQNNRYYHFYKNSYFILPDGAPIIFFSRIINAPLTKLSGSDLFPLIWSSFKLKNSRVLLIVSSNKVREGLLAQYPQAKIIVARNLNLNDERTFLPDVEECIEIIETHQIEYVLIGLGFPKQELLGKVIFEILLDRNRKETIPLFMLLGASFEFHLNIKRRSPNWMQNIGLEWLHRLVSEPRRLWRRYTLGNIEFLLLFIKYLFSYIVSHFKDKRSNSLD